MTNITASTVGDLSLVGVLRRWRRCTRWPPRRSPPSSLALTIVVALFLFSRVKRGWRAYQAWRAERRTGTA